MFDYQDGVAVITGGGGLLGRAMALAFAGKGMDVVLADRDLSAAQSAAEEVADKTGRRTLAVETDVSRLEAMEALADAAYSRFGKVNILVNNAGGSIRTPLPDTTMETWHKVLGGNLFGVIHGNHAFLPRLMAQRSSPRHIVNVASMSGVGLARLRHLNAPYVTAKFAVVGYTETTKPVLKEHGIGASVLCPGWAIAEPDKPVKAFPLPSAEWYKDNLMGAAEVAREVVHGIDEDRLYIFPHRDGLGEVEGRHEGLLEGFRQAALTSPPRKPYAF